MSSSPTDGPTDLSPPEPLSLADFLEMRRGLVSTLSLFAALTTFSGNIAWGVEFRAVLSGLFLLITVLLMVELWISLNGEIRRRGVQRGRLFATLLVVALGVLATSWLIEFPFLWIEALPLEIALLAVWLLRARVASGVQALLGQRGPGDAASARRRELLVGVCLALVGVIVYFSVSATGLPVRDALYTIVGRIDAALPSVLPQAPPGHAPTIPSPTATAAPGGP